MSIIQDLPFFINPLDDQPLKSGYLRHYSDKARLNFIKQYSIADGWIYPALPGNALPKGYYSLFNADHLRLMDFQEWLQTDYWDVANKLADAKNKLEGVKANLPRALQAPPIAEKWTGTLKGMNMHSTTGDSEYTQENEDKTNALRGWPSFEFRASISDDQGLSLRGAINLDATPVNLLGYNLSVDIRNPKDTRFLVIIISYPFGSRTFYGYGDKSSFNEVREGGIMTVRNINLKAAYAGDADGFIEKFTINHKYPLIDLTGSPRDSFTRIIPANFDGNGSGTGDVYRISQLYNQDGYSANFKFSRFNHPCTFYKDKNNILYWAG